MEVGAARVESGERDGLPCSAYLAWTESRAATIEASQICDSLKSVNGQSELGAGGYEICPFLFLNPRPLVRRSPLPGI